jgi:ribosome recycling factor
MRIRELANISTPEARMLVIQPWDMASIQPIEKAIQKANLGLSPVVQGKVIRIAFPELSTERRQEFVKMTKKMGEDGRVAVRHVRRDAMEQLKKSVKDGETSEEEQEKTEKEIQKLTDQYSTKIDQHLANKEKEIMTV